MTWYLTIYPPAGRPRSVETRSLVDFLASLPELQQTGPISFEAAPGQPWVHVVLASGSPWSYSSDGSFVPQIHVVELICSYSWDGAWYDALARRIAAFLGWVAVEESEDRQVWPIERRPA